MLLASALSFSAAPTAANGQMPIAGAAFGTVLEPMIATVRMAAEAKNAAAAWTLRTGSLWAILAERIAAMDPGGQRLTVAIAHTETTGSIAGRAQPPAARTRKAQAELLASVAIPFGRLPALARMKPIYAEMDAGLFQDCRTATCENARATLATVVEHGRKGRFLELIGAVNRSVNRLVAYRRDRDVHGIVDYWAKPSQTLNAGTGDCEDYAILKMAVLARAGVPAKSMSLVVLRDERRSVYHAVLAIRTSGGSYILDNLDPAVRRDVELSDYMPLYSLSAGRGYIYGRRSGKSLLSASAAGFDAITPGEGLDVPERSSALPPAPRELRGPF